MARHNHVDLSRKVLAELGFYLAADQRIISGRAEAARLVGEAITPADRLIAIQARTRCSTFVLDAPDGRMSGIVSIIPVCAEGLARLERGDFDGINPDPALACAPEDQVAAFYGWGMAGLTWRGRISVVHAALALQQEVFGHVPFFSRAATSEGEKVLLNRMGARPHSAPGGLVWAPALSANRKAA